MLCQAPSHHDRTSWRFFSTSWRTACCHCMTPISYWHIFSNNFPIFPTSLDIFRACKNTSKCVNVSWSIPLTALHAAWALDTRPGALGLLASPTTPYSGINISHLAKRKLIFKCALVWDILISRRVYIWNTQGHHEKERKTILEFLVPSWNRNDFSIVKTHHLPGGFCQVSAAFLKSPGFVYCGKMTEQRYLKYESGCSIAFFSCHDQTALDIPCYPCFLVRLEFKNPPYDIFDLL